MMDEQHEWELIFNPDNSFRRVKCKNCPEQMSDAEIESRLNKYAKLESTNAALLDVVRDCVNFLADLDTKSDRAKALHKRAYTAHSKAKEKRDDNTTS